MNRVTSVVSVNWLNSRLLTPNIRVIDASWHLPSTGRKAHEEYVSKHIPDAQFFDIDGCIDKASPYVHMLPSTKEFEEYVGKLGINNHTHVIIYDNNEKFGTLSAARVWWAFKVFGHPMVSILDGGLPAWCREGKQTTNKESKCSPETFKATFNSSMVKYYDDVKENLLKKQFQVMDARPPGRFKGTEPEPVAAKDKLYNDVCEELKRSAAEFPKSLLPDEVMKQVGAIVDLLWYIDGNVSTIQERSTHVPTEITPVPNRFLKFEGYNDWRKKKSKKPQLHAKDLDIHSQIIFRLTSKPYVQVWNNELKNDLNSLAASLSSYAFYLKSNNIKQQTRQQQLYPIRQVTGNIWTEYKPASATTVAPEYAIIETALGELKDFEILFFDPDVHQISSKTGSQKYQEKFRFFDNLHLSQDVALLSYDPGGSQTSSKVIWKIPARVGSSELMTTASRVVKDLGSRLSEFHTRQMKRDFTRKFCSVAGSKIPSHVLRAIYAELTLDASSDQNPVIDARVRQAVLAGDPDLAVDMHHLNKGRPDDAFDAFFQELEKQIESITAADERRHNVEHISRFISVRDLIEQVKSRLPPNTAVPSESTVLFAFVPKNAHTKVAKLYKSRVPLRFTVQTRQLRASHQDDHYCAAQFKYMREFAVKHRDRVTFVCLDDKSKLDFGEPGAALSSGVRGKKSVVPTTSTLSCLDHDVGQKGSITPSVCLNVEIPETPDGSFYRGQVTVIFKDSIFQPSSPFRHAVELQNILAQEGTFKPVLMMFTDGGPDHRVTYHAVKLSLIILFRRLGLDMIVAGRTAPGHSWANPAERIMSLLNLAFQNAALTRNECTSAVEQALMSCNSMEDIRKKSQTVPGLEDAWVASLQEMEKKCFRRELSGSS